MTRIIPLMAAMLIAAVGCAKAQDQYDEGLLAVKLRFANQELEAISKKFNGVTADGELVPDLFPIQQTGVSTDPIVSAAAAFLDSLSPTQKIRTQFSIGDREWRRWSNVDNGIYVRQGVSLKEMTDAQRQAAMDLMRSSLSAQGLALSEAIMKTDQTLREINNDILSYDEDLYFFTLMGVPSKTEPWGWQIDGHHLVINYFVLGDQIVMTPAFFGAEPVNTTSGKYAGNIILQAEQDLGLALINSLDDGQKADAILSFDKTKNNNRAAANKDNVVIAYEGARVSAFSEIQKQQLRDLIGLFVNNMNEGHARIRMQEVEAHLDETRFAWIGKTSDDAVFYYRIHSPVILIEFDHQNPVGATSFNKAGTPTRDHIHVVVRTPNGNDYGKDLLRQHLDAHAH